MSTQTCLLFIFWNPAVGYSNGYNYYCYLIIITHFIWEQLQRAMWFEVLVETELVTQSAEEKD